MKPTTARNIAILLMLALAAYFIHKAATKGIQSISIQDWLAFLLDIGIGVVILVGAYIKMCQ